jgi:hypothetical protein
MSTVQRVVKNTAISLVAQVASYPLAFFSMVYATGYPVLDNYHLRLLGMDDMRPWQKALQDYLAAKGHAGQERD